MIKTILLTGATGFLGSHLLEELLRKNCGVIILKRRFSDIWRIKSLLNKVKSYDIDLVSIEEIFGANNIDCVIHLATHYNKVHNEEDIEKFTESIVKLPVLILEQMVKHDVKFFINTGTFFEYELGSRPIDESTRKKAYNLYAAFKIAFSEILKYYSNNFGTKSIDLKLFAPYGPKDAEKLLVYLIKNFINNTNFEVTKGEQKWDWTYAKDIVDAYIKSLKYFEKMRSKYEVFNIGSDSAHSIREIISMLEKISGKRGLTSYSKEYPKNEIFYVNCDNAKAKRLLGWKPKYGLYKGLKETYDYYSNLK